MIPADSPPPSCFGPAAGDAPAGRDRGGRVRRPPSAHDGSTGRGQDDAGPGGGSPDEAGRGHPRMGQMAAPIGKRRGHVGAISGVPALRFSARGWGRLLSRTGRAYCRFQGASRTPHKGFCRVVLCGFSGPTEPPIVPAVGGWLIRLGALGAGDSCPCRYGFAQMAANWWRGSPPPVCRAQPLVLLNM